jgi:hypothetical protein
MGKWYDYNSFNGLQETNVFDEDTGLLTVAKSEDVEPLLDRNAEIRNTRAADKGIQKGFALYCSIPMTVQYELLKKGISVLNKHHRKRLLDEINQNYPYLKVTNKTHSLGRNKPKKEATSKPRGPFVIVR